MYLNPNQIVRINLCVLVESAGSRRGRAAMPYTPRTTASEDRIGHEQHKEDAAVQRVAQRKDAKGAAYIKIMCLARRFATIRKERQ
jgi:hypothetical protein